MDAIVDTLASMNTAAAETHAEFQPLPTTREERGRQIAQLGGIRQVGSHYAVPSQTGGAPRFLVDLVEPTCTCADFTLRRKPCKHYEAALLSIVWGCEMQADGTVTETATVTVQRRKAIPRDWG